MTWNKGKKHGGGLSAVSSEMGEKLYIKNIFHDDGMKGLGGKRTMTVGDLGSGKTTLALETALKFCYLPNMKKEDFLNGKEHDMAEVYPETVVWRGRKRDYWNLFTKKNFSKSFPGNLWKPLRVLYSITDKLDFFEDIDGTPVPIEGLDMYQYSNTEDLYNHILQGGINVIYPPKIYYLSPLLKTTLNEIQLLEQDDRRYIQPDAEVHVPNFVFWYDLFYFLIEVDKNFDRVADNYRKLRWITFVFDEAHQIFPVAKAPLWHLVDHFAEHEMIDTRRVNISIWAQVHEVGYIFWKVMNRFDTFIWLPRSKENKRLSCIDQRLINKLEIGWGIIEEKGGKFGKFNFPRIKHQPSVLSVRGFD